MTTSVADRLAGSLTPEALLSVARWLRWVEDECNDDGTVTVASLALSVADRCRPASQLLDELERLRRAGDGLHALLDTTIEWDTEDEELIAEAALAAWEEVRRV